MIFLVLTLFSSFTWAQEPMDEEGEISDQQRCEEWAQIDGIGQDDMQGYLQECLSSLRYEESMQEPISAEGE